MGNHWPGIASVRLKAPPHRKRPTPWRLLQTALTTLICEGPHCGGVQEIRMGQIHQVDSAQHRGYVSARAKAAADKTFADLA